MALDPSSGYVAASNLQDATDAALPIFDVQRVRLQFDISSDFVAAQVANNVLVLALSTGRILRFDLDNAEDVDDIDLPKRPAEVGVIRRMFLDPSASHLIVSTTQGENYYLHTQSRQPKPLSRLKGVHVESVAWNPSLPSSSTREILIGAADGNVYETYIETSTEFYRREEKYRQTVYSTQDGAVTGLWVDTLPGRPDFRRVLVATQGKLLHFVGRLGRQGQEGSGSLFQKLFEAETPTIYESPKISIPAPSCLAISPEVSDPAASNLSDSARTFAWLSSQGIYHGTLLTNLEPSVLGKKVFADSRLLPRSATPPSQTTGGRSRSVQVPAQSAILSHFHIIQLVEGRVIAFNRLNDAVVHDQLVLEEGQASLGLFCDQRKNTFWLFTKREIFEIVANDESRDSWRIMLQRQQFGAASRFAKTAAQKDAVATASGDYLVNKGQFAEAAAVYGKSTKPFEQVALTFIDKGEQDALRKYLLMKLSMFKKPFIMQRIMLASWITELYMAKLNLLDDTISTKAELSDGTNTTETKNQLSVVRKEYQDFIARFKSDLDRKTTYDIISSHGREEELLHFATVIDDYNYVLAYWIQRERWTEAMVVLRKQTDPEIFYKYSTVLMAHVAMDLVEILMRQPTLEARKLIPALLNYNKTTQASLGQNQAVRYLQFHITHQHSTLAAVHNTLLSIYASHPTPDEAALLSYFETQSAAQEQNYDADFALRLCIQHKRIRSCVHIYCTMNQFASAVDMALKHDEVELAAIVADRPDNDPALRKKLWLRVAKKVIGRERGIKSAIDFLKRCELLRIEDLIPFFPDFVVIDDFKDEICAALEEYSRQIDALKHEMDDSASTAAHIKEDIKALDQRYAIVEPGERCWNCRLPLLSRQFFVFPCQHAFHADCLGKMVMRMIGMNRGKRIRELQAEVGRGIVGGAKRERMVKELDGLVGGACVLCSEMAVKQIDEPFVLPTDNKDEWAL
ncbi:tethering complex subunit [Elasticomyces elasticus]|nr:tethering complex subunit [Elasticomyces elasticus]KAK4986964.1 tethering complex subunit [Elasticomyces elasticus]